MPVAAGSRTGAEQFPDPWRIPAADRAQAGAEATDVTPPHFFRSDSAALAFVCNPRRSGRTLLQQRVSMATVRTSAWSLALVRL
jgi:hypothetical protein